MLRIFVRLITLTLCFSAALAYGQTVGTINGRITTDGRALADISVKLEPGGQTVTTDATGRYALSNLAPGKYTLTITGGGFVPQTREVEISAGRTAVSQASAAAR